MEHIDISAKVCELFPRDYATEIPMLSFSRPSCILWNAIANGLHQKGWTKTEIKDWLQSRRTRHALDDTLGTMLEKTGAKYAAMLNDDDKVK